MHHAQEFQNQRESEKVRLPPLRTIPSISNPLGLLAEASGAARNVPDSAAGGMHDFIRHMLQSDQNALDPVVTALGLGSEEVTQSLSALTQINIPKVSESPSLSAPMKTIRDVDPELDPLSLALLTEEQVDLFWRTFFSNLHPLIAILDPSIHVRPFSCEFHSHFSCNIYIDPVVSATR